MLGNGRKTHSEDKGERDQISREILRAKFSKLN
jgi:hypothetical protein